LNGPKLTSQNLQDKATFYWTEPHIPIF